MLPQSLELSIAELGPEVATVVSLGHSLATANDANDGTNDVTKLNDELTQKWTELRAKAEVAVLFLPIRLCQ